MMKRSSKAKASRPRRRSRVPLWLVETLDIVRLRRRLLLSTVIAVIAAGIAATLLVPEVVPTVPVVGAALGFAAVLLGLAVVIAVDAGDLVVRGPRHVRAAGGELVAILPAAPGPTSIDPLADAALDARGPDSKLILGFATAGDDVTSTRRLTDELAVALARRDVSVLRADLAGGISAGPGLYEVARDEIRLARAVSFETELKLAWIGPGRDVAGALAAIPQLPAMLPRDLDVFVVAFPTATSKQVVRAAASLDHVLLVVRRGVTSRVDLIAALDALDAAGCVPQVVLLDDRSAQWLGVHATAATTAEQDAEPEPEAAAVADTVPEPGLDAAADSDAVPVHEPAAELDSGAEFEPEAASEPEAELETATDAVPDDPSDAVPDAALGAEPVAEPMVDPAVDPDPITESAPTLGAEASPDTETAEDARPQAELEAVPQPELEVEWGPGSELASERQLGYEPDPEPDSEPDPEPEPAPEREPEPDSEPDPSGLSDPDVRDAPGRGSPTGSAAGFDLPPLPPILPVGAEPVADQPDPPSAAEVPDGEVRDAEVRPESARGDGDDAPSEVVTSSEPALGVGRADERGAVTPRDVAVMVGAAEAAAAAEVAEDRVADDDSRPLAPPESRIVSNEPATPEPAPADLEPDPAPESDPAPEPDPTLAPEPAPAPLEPADPWAHAAASLFDGEVLLDDTHPTDELEPIRLDEPAPDTRRRRDPAPSDPAPSDPAPSDPATSDPAPSDAADPAGAQQPELTLNPDADDPQDDPLLTTAQMAAILEEFEGRDEGS